MHTSSGGPTKDRAPSQHAPGGGRTRQGTPGRLRRGDSAEPETANGEFPRLGDTPAPNPAAAAGVLHRYTHTGGGGSVHGSGSVHPSAPPPRRRGRFKGGGGAPPGRPARRRLSSPRLAAAPRSLSLSLPRPALKSPPGSGLARHFLYGRMERAGAPADRRPPARARRRL